MLQGIAMTDKMNFTIENPLVFDRWRRAVDEAFKHQSDSIISNGTNESVAYLMSKIIENAQNKIGILTGSLGVLSQKQDIYCDQFFIDKLKGFFKKPQASLQIFIADINFQNTESEFLSTLKKCSFGKQIKIFKNENATEPFNYLSHFMVNDNSAYRIEKDIETTEASGQAYNPEISQRLWTIMDLLSSLPNFKPINLD